MLEEMDYYDEPKCYKCYEMEKVVYEGAEIFSDVLNLLYSKEPLDLLVLQNLLDDVGYFFGLPARDGDLQIKRDENY